MGYDRNDSDAMLSKLTQVEFLLECFTEKATIAMDNNEIEGVFAVACALDHLLERWATIVGGSARFDKFGDNIVTLCFAPGPELVALIRYGQVVL